ncbi:MAG: biotin--[acetyl-CoA-carboxylase] ligase [Bacillota bacterium]
MNKIRLEIVKLLHQNPDSFVSGQELSDKLGVSRTTISNYIKDLRHKGYKIKSKTNKGYKLLKSPDMIIPEEILWKLSTEKIGKNIKFYNEIDSTNEKAKEIAGKVPGGTVILTEKQKKGKGRRGREWYSPAGSGLWFSIILYPDFQPDKAPMLTVLAALSVEESLDDMNIATDIKWPNDIILNNKKIAGILSELNAEIDQINYAVVGIGINVNQDSFPQNLKDIASSLKIETGKNIDRVNLLNNIFYSFERYYKMLLSDKEEELLKIWKNKLKCLNKRVVIDSNGKIYRGKAVDVSLKGELVIKDEKGKEHSFWTGDTSLKEWCEEGEKI